MTGWVAATAAAAMIGAAAVAPGTYGQSFTVTQSLDSAPLSPELEQIVRVWKSSGSQIGLTIRDLTPDDLKSKAGTTGVVIEEVETDSPASKAGFRAGDVVVEFDGERVRSTRQFTRLVQETAGGRPVQTAVLRDGQRVTLSVEPREGGPFRGSGGLKNFGDLQYAPKAIVPPARLEMMPKIATAFGTGRLGISVNDLSPQLAEYFSTKEGVLVTSVTADSIASKSGVRAGDVITALDGGAVSTSADLRRRVQRLEQGDEFTLGIVRDKKAMSLKGKLEPAAAKPSKARTIL
jgi:serine protease Do